MEARDLHRYDGSVDAVLRFFVDPDIVKTKYVGTGARNVEFLQLDDRDGVSVIRTRREVPADVPALLKKFLGAWNTVLQTERWRATDDGGWLCALEVDVVRVPVTVRGTLTLRPEGEGCVNDVRIDIACGIPLLGRKLERFVAGDTKKAMDAEFAYISRQLEATGGG